jgi:DNA-binding NarL/FixJ family response regulator
VTAVNKAARNTTDRGEAGWHRSAIPVPRRSEIVSGSRHVGAGSGRAEQRTRVLFLEDHLLLAESLRIALHADGVDVVPARLPQDPAQVSQLVRMVQAARPDIILVDLDLEDVQADLALVAPLVRAGRPVVVLTAAADELRWGACALVGVAGVLSKSLGLGDIRQTLHRLSCGQSVITAARRAELVDGWNRHCREQSQLRTVLDRLSTREGQVLAALVAGQRVRDMAVSSFVSEATVRSQVKSILNKLGVNSQIAAVAMVRGAQWTPKAAAGHR